jgi:hypothetical protein
MSWKVTVAVYHYNEFQLYLFTGVVDRSPVSDLEFEQGGSPLVSMPAIPVIHLLNDSQLLEKVLLQLYLINIIKNNFFNFTFVHTYSFILSFIHSFIHSVVCSKVSSPESVM